MFINSKQFQSFKLHRKVQLELIESEAFKLFKAALIASHQSSRPPSWKGNPFQFHSVRASSLRRTLFNSATNRTSTLVNISRGSLAFFLLFPLPPSHPAFNVCRRSKLVFLPFVISLNWKVTVAPLSFRRRCFC